MFQSSNADSRPGAPTICLTFPRPTRQSSQSILIRHYRPTAGSFHVPIGCDEVHLQTLSLDEGLNVVLHGAERGGSSRHVRRHVFRKYSRHVPRSIIDITRIHERYAFRHGNAPPGTHSSQSSRKNLNEATYLQWAFRQERMGRGLLARL